MDKDLEPCYAILMHNKVPSVPVQPTRSLGSLATESSILASEKLLSKAEMAWTQPVISVRKILENKSMECLMMGNLHRVKMLQFAEPLIKETILTRASQDTLGIIKHSITLLRGSLESRMELMDAWKLRDTEDASSLSHFDSTTNPNRIMNILIWNCKGAMKPLFRKTVMDLVA